MQMDFHYYATYCAAYIAGYSHEESLAIATSAQFVDECSVTVLKSIKGPVEAATTQLQLELMDIKLDPVSLQKITRIWSSFHFLPYDLYYTFPKRRNKAYMDKYRLICRPNGKLLGETIELAKGQGLQAVGIAMHILADTWAHSYFAGVPSLVINNTNFQFYEVGPDGAEKPIEFIHNPIAADDIDLGKYTNSLYQSTELSVMNLGHGRAGHLPDYSFMHYRYVPAWGNYDMLDKNNPAEYYNAFGQMVHAMKYLRGAIDSFTLECYEEDTLRNWENEIKSILSKRQLNACADWKTFAKKLSGYEIKDFSVEKYKNEYVTAAKNDKENTFVGQFIIAAMAQKSMVTNRIFKSGNLLAGFSIDYNTRRKNSIKKFSGDIFGFFRRKKP